MFLLLNLIKLRASYTLIYEFDASQNIISPGWSFWPSQPGFTTCNTASIFGGYNELNETNDNLFYNHVNKMPHYNMKIEVLVSRRGDWVGDDMLVGIYEIGYTRSHSIINSATDCNSMQYEEDLFIFDVGHYFRSAQIRVIPFKRTSDTMFWGIRQLKLFVKQCKPQCDYCKFEHDDCQLELAISSLTQLQLQNFDGWLIQDPSKYSIEPGRLNYLYFRQIPIYQIFQLKYHEYIKIQLRKADSLLVWVQLNSSPSTVSLYCNSLNYVCQTDVILHSSPQIITILPSSDQQNRGMIRDFEIFIGIGKSQESQIEFHLLECVIQVSRKCLRCQEGWSVDNDQQCQPICGDGLIRGNEECDYGNNRKYYPNCFNCKYQCAYYCINCKFGICFQCEEGYYLNKKNICIQHSIDSFLKNYQYYRCEEGWAMNPILQQCQPICGDGLIRGDEECDYGNVIKTYSNCINCKYKCDQYCISCQFGICSYCEQCDDGNNIKGDGCYEGQYECPQNCAFCNKVDCLKCQNGFNPNYGQCSSICGDKIVIKDFEECDDGNNIEYDGCFNCQFSCIKDCNICKNGQCLLKCEEGYEFQQDQCVSICGDLVKTKDEECDDGNIVPFDGCFECKLSCPLNCKECLLDICLECNQFYELDKNLCNPVVNCGNGQLDFKEECDDLNLDPNDGCFNCLIEDNWICLQVDLNQPSECSFQQSVIASLTYLNMTGNIQYVELEFSDKVKVSEFKTLSETITYSILELTDDKYQINLIIIQEASQEINQAIYLFEIEINEILKTQPFLKLDLGQPVYSAVDQAIKQNELTIKLKYAKQLTQVQKQQAQNLLTLNKAAIFSLVGFAVLSLLFGVIDPLLEIINILSYQQYLRYLNIDFPLNLEIYFSINDLIDIIPLTDFLHFDFVMTSLQVPINFKKSNGKFVNYYQNSDLLTNLQAQIIQTLLTIIISLLLSQKNTDQLFYGKILNSKFFHYAQSTNSVVFRKILFYICLVIFKTGQMILALKNVISKEGINQIFFINGWDVIFKVCF